MDQAESLPKRTTPTWEMELLISGALVFSLLNLPVVLDEFALWLWPKFSVDFLSYAVVIHLYLRSALLGLAGAFVMHLCLRAYWVALVGVNSVFADAPNWQKSSHGPLMQNELRQSWVPLAHRIDACDNAASLVFATGIALGLMLLSLSITVLPVGALSAVLAKLSLDSKLWFLIILAVLFVPALLAYIVDFFFGKRIRTGSRLARLIALAFRSQRWLPGMAHANAIYQSIRFNLTARGPKLWFSFLMILPLALGVWTTPLLSRDQSSRLYEAEANSSLLSQPQHYRDQRLGMERFSMLPFVASREVKEEAIELFVPIRATQVQRITTDCAEFRSLEDASSKDQRDHAWLVCMAKLFAPTLDGVRLDDRDVLYSIDASSGLEGLLWRIPNASISTGKHIITVADQRKTEPSQASHPPFRIVVFR